MKDFDADRHRQDPPVSDRQFKLRGRTFTIRPFVRPEAVALIEDAGQLGSSIATLAQIDEGVCMYLVPEDRDAWMGLRADEDDPLVLDDMLDVSEWLMEYEARRPTRAPSASTDGRAAANGSSTATSPPQEATQTA